MIQNLWTSENRLAEMNFLVTQTKPSSIRVRKFINKRIMLTF